MQFKDRKEELHILESTYRSNKPRLIIVWGRRRVGKTYLLNKFLEGKKGKYFYIPSGGTQTLLASLSSSAGDDFFEGFRFSNIESFLNYISEKLSKGFVVVIDEFQRLDSVPGAISLLQKYWDERFSREGGMLILCGSAIGLIRKVAFSGNSPLYGRRTHSLEITPMSFSTFNEWFPDYGFEDLHKTYAMFGGTPAYLSMIGQDKRPEENMFSLILSKNGTLHNEPEFLLMQEVRAPERYMDILASISAGKDRFSEISDDTGIGRESLSAYLQNLEELGLVKRTFPIQYNKKRPRFRIEDNFFRFWFRFVYPNRQSIEIGLEKQVWEKEKQNFNSYLGLVFEDVSSGFIASMVKKGMIKADLIGRWEYLGEEIDIVAYSSAEKKTYLFEVKWSELEQREALDIINKLKLKGFNASEKRYGIVGRKIKDKQGIREKGYLAFDQVDIGSELFGDTVDHLAEEGQI